MVLAVTGVVVVARALAGSGLLQATSGGGSSDTDGSDEYQVRCRSCGELVDEDDVEDGVCEDCFDSDEPNCCCGIMYTDGESFCGSCGDPL